VVRALNAPFPLVVVAGGWPSELIAVLSLGLTLLGAYFPSKFHRYFKPKGGLTTWFVPSDVKSTVVPEEVGILVLGSPAFICRILVEIGPTRRLIIPVLPCLWDATSRGLRNDRVAAKALLSQHNLHPVSFPDADNGGATDVCHVFGFGDDLGSTCLPGSTMGLLQTLRHFLDEGTKGFFPESARVPRSSIPDVAAPPQKVLWHLDAVLGEGLFPCSRPQSVVSCPSHFFPWHWIRRPLSLPELLWLYQLPLSMDSLLRALSPHQGLPFEDSPHPDLFVSIFQQLWGVNGGGVDSDKVSVETPNCVGMEGDEEGITVGEPLENEEGNPLEKGEDDTKEVEMEGEEVGMEGDMVATLVASLQTPPCVMTATMLETQADVSRDKPLRHIDLGDTFVDLEEGLTDEDTVTSAASKEILQGGSSVTTQGDLEPHEIGGVLFNPAPPFPVGDIILYDSGCGHDANGRRQLRAFVIKSDHPRYQLRLESGVMVSTSMQEALLMPRLATWPGNPNDLAPDQDDPFVDIR
jgi:hypothetical protein